MSDFARLFLNEDWESLPGTPRVYVAAFGKHPGWNDHLDDIGLLTGSLVSLRRILYGSGIASQIESAAWENAEPGSTLPAFDHVMLWNRPGESIVGRITASRDGKGRGLYPLVVIAHCVGQSFDWIAADALPILDRAVAACAAATTSSGVVAALNAAQQALRARAGEPRPSVAIEDSPVGLAAWTAYFCRERALLERVFHHLQAHLAMFEPGTEAWCIGNGPARSRSLRLPVIPHATAAETLNAWLSFLATQLDPAVPLLGLLPRGQTWVDVIVGEPTPADFFALRANLSAVPVITEIPYQIDASMRDRLQSVFHDLARGRLPEFSALNLELLSRNREAADKWLARFRSGRHKGIFGRLMTPGGSHGMTRFVPHRV